MDIETTLAGKLKLGTLILGGLTVALAAPSLCTNKQIYSSCTGVSKERYFLAISCIALILSFLMVAATIFNVPRRWTKWGILDLGFHILMAVLISVGWVVFVMNVADLSEKTSSDFKKQKIYIEFMTKRSFALIFQLLNCISYLVIAFLVFRKR